MSSTRKAKDDSGFHQNRYASSPEFERGLVASLVARRCSVLDYKAARELIWFVHYLSHQEGGLAAVAKDLIAKYPERLQTVEMLKIGMKAGKVCTTEQVKQIRDGFYCDNAIWAFRLRDDEKTYDEVWDCDLSGNNTVPLEVRHCGIAAKKEAPSTYPAEDFLKFCHTAAQGDLSDFLSVICLDPACGESPSPWYFPQFFTALREYRDNFIKAAGEGEFNTALGQKVFETLDYTAHCRGLTLIQGEARLGKSHAGRSWCKLHPGSARFVQVPTGNDDLTFFHALARGLGLGNFTSYKTVQIRSRIESVLLEGQIVLVLDEAQRLWPQTNLREGYPKRIAWIMDMADKNVPICMISTPQFFSTQKAVEKNGWNSAQLTGRLLHSEFLPLELSQEDLIGVAKAILPEASATVLLALATYARTSARYLAAINSIATRASYIASRSGRDSVTTQDVRTAMKESVIPADSKLCRALEAGNKGKRMLPAPVMRDPAPAPEEIQQPLPESRNTSIVDHAPAFPSRNIALVNSDSNRAFNADLTTA